MTKHIDTNCKWFFIDLTSGENLEDGLPYFAAGIVVDFFDLNCPSGKHMVVEYISPFGEARREWRSKESVRLIKADSFGYTRICDSIVDAQGEYL